MDLLLASRWWTLALRGAAAILFGVLTMFAPGLSLYALVIMFGAYALVDGAFALASAFRGRAAGRAFGSLIIGGIASIVAGVLTFLWPGITALALLLLIAGWAVVTGVAEILAAVRLRKQIRGEWFLALSGVLSVVFGVMLFVFPGAGALAVAFWIGAYAMIYGALLLALSLRLRAWTQRTHGEFPRGAAQTPA